MLFLGAIFLPFAGAGAARQQPTPMFPVALEVPSAPTAFKANGKLNLVYELHATSFRAGDLLLTRVEVLNDDEAAAAPLASYAEADLKNLLARPGTGGQLSDPRLIAAGMRAVVYLWLTFDNAAAVPARLRHRLYFKIPNAAAGEEKVVDGGGVAVRRDGPVRIGPPVRGAGWVARFNGSTSFHRRGLLVVNGQAAISQRFATDWGKFGDDWNALRTGDGSKNTDFYCYGEPLIAVADAKVVEVRDRIPENDPSKSTTAVPISFDTVAGNHVVLDIGGGRYALYAHMQPGKMRVRVGDRVKRGQVLGLLGNSGNAVGPHLHFQIADSPVALGGEGLPFVFDSFEVLGVESPQALKDGVWRPDPNFKVERRRLEMPIDSVVVRFP
ncbi:MAG: M23 family metallopeptidase [Acidobacteria bacterium]|nr:M23 family metallopeptidase [Acidobacteriota bacterium]